MNYTCPCCGYLNYCEPPGSYEICSICYWEDAPVQLLDPRYAGGANAISLQEAQVNYSQYGVSEIRYLHDVRSSKGSEEKDPEGRPLRDVDLNSPRKPADIDEDEWENLDVWYYWRE